MAIRENQFLGLIKFFRDEAFLDALIDGTIYCNTPEHYRLATADGVADKNESCVSSYRRERDVHEPTLVLGGHEVKDVVSFTLHNGGKQDTWLHCWFCLRFPKDQEALEQLIADIGRMKAEFGEHYALVTAPQFQNFKDTLQKTAPKRLSHGEVKYTDSSSEWGTLCKSTSYSYQREFRFTFGECPVGSTEPLVWTHEPGFKEIVLKNADLKMINSETTELYFDLLGTAKR